MKTLNEANFSNWPINAVCFTSGHSAQSLRTVLPPGIGERCRLRVIQQSRLQWRRAKRGTGIPCGASGMSALGQKQTIALQKVMSALPPKADMCSATRDVRFVPIADMNKNSLATRWYWSVPC